MLHVRLSYVIKVLTYLLTYSVDAAQLFTTYKAKLVHRRLRPGTPCTKDSARPAPAVVCDTTQQIRRSSGVSPFKTLR